MCFRHTCLNIQWRWGLISNCCPKRIGFNFVIYSDVFTTYDAPRPAVCNVLTVNAVHRVRTWWVRDGDSSLAGVEASAMHSSPQAGCTRERHDRRRTVTPCIVEASWNVMAHAKKPDFVFLRNGRIHLNRLGRHFGRLLAAEVCASAVVMLATPCSEVVWRVLVTHSIRQFPLHFPSRAAPCAITFQQESNRSAKVSDICDIFLQLWSLALADVLQICLILWPIGTDQKVAVLFNVSRTVDCCQRLLVPRTLVVLLTAL